MPLLEFACLAPPRRRRRRHRHRHRRRAPYKSLKLCLWPVACRQWSTAARAAAVAVCNHRIRQHAARQGASDSRVSAAGAAARAEGVAGPAQPSLTCAHVVPPTQWPACRSFAGTLPRSFATFMQWSGSWQTCRWRCTSTWARGARWAEQAGATGLHKAGSRGAGFVICAGFVSTTVLHKAGSRGAGFVSSM